MSEGETMDVVATCPAGFFDKWIAGGDPAGDLPTGREYIWWTDAGLAQHIMVGERFYVVARGRLRGYALVTGLRRGVFTGRVCGVIRAGGAVACTIPESVRGFRGLRRRWWPRSTEVPFPNWRTA